MRPFTLLIISTLLSGCTVEKYLKVTGGSKSDGVIEMKYTYGAFEDPEVQWEEAKKKAVNRCRQWGYSGARFFESGTRNCISYD